MTKSQADTIKRQRTFSPWPWQPMSLHGWLTLAALCFGIAPWIAGCGVGTTLNKEAPQEHYLSFKGKPENSQDLELIGPNAKACVRFEPAGLRITLPANHPKEKPTGLATCLDVKGAFEITMPFEILQEPEPIEAGDFGTRLALTVGYDAPEENGVKFTRAVRAADGSQFLAFSSQWNSTSNKLDKRNKSFPTTAKKGRLRLARQGDLLFFSVSEGDNTEFTPLREYPFSEADLKNVRIVGSTGSPKASLDVRIADLHIRMWPKNPPSPSKGWLTAGLLIGLIIMFLLFSGIWLFVRRRRRTGEVPAAAE